MKQGTDQIRVFITDFEDVYRKGICWALSDIESFEIIGEATTNIETLERMLKTPADLLILNADHNKPSGIDVARYISHKLPDVKMILMMDEYRTGDVVGAMKSGAKTCFNKAINLDVFVQTVNRVIHDELPIGHFLLKPKVADFILTEYDVSDQVTEKTDRAGIRLLKSEQMILNRIRENPPLSELINNLGISREVLSEYLDEIAEKLVKIEYYNETPEQRYTSNLISRHLGVMTNRQAEKPGDRSYDVHADWIESGLVDNSVPDIDSRFDAGEREERRISHQSAEINEPVEEISEALELARKAGRLSSIHELNQYIMSITEDLMTEIDRRRRVLRRIRNAIAFELEFTKGLDFTRN